MFAVETSGLTKRYGNLAAVDDLALTVPEGSAFGFLGPNGAGKTTTVRMLMGLAKPTSGTARVLGNDVASSNVAQRNVGFLPDVPAFYGWMRAAEYLVFCGRLHAIDADQLGKRVDELLEFVGLAGVKTRIGGFSRGMKQRLGLAQALINQPKLVILDEPTSALDPIGRREVLEAIRSLRDTSKATVLFSTHILADVERVCDRVAILDRGRLVTEEPIRELKARYARPLFVVTVSMNGAQPGAAGSKLAAALGGHGWVEDIEQDGDLLRVTALDTGAGRTGIPQAVVDAGLGLVRLEESEPTLEDIFVRLVGKQ